MQFSRLAESAITDKLKSELPPKVLLYHGTSSGKISKIMDQGLRVPRGSIYDYLMKVARETLDAVMASPEARRILDEYLPGFKAEDASANLDLYVRGYIHNTRVAYSKVSVESDAYIYMAPAWKTAIGYAHQAAQHGSEAYERGRWAIINAIAELAGEHYREVSGTLGKVVPTRFSGDGAMVVAAWVPWEATDIDTGKVLRNVRLMVEVQEDSLGKQSRRLNYGQAVYDASKGGEVLVHRDIPASDILWGTPEGGSGLIEFERAAGWIVDF